MDSFLKKELNLKYFHKNGYIRKKCSSCGAYYWTLDKNSKLCGDQPCVKFSFINNPIGKKPLSLSEVREKFLSFFEKNNHSRISYPETGERCPVVARWRTDIYLTIASIADFQPHVTSGEVPAPANPLVISQPCIRLNDLEEVGVSGRHLTIFEMMGHHAFNKNVDEIYFKEETVRFCNEFFVNIIGIPKNSINYKEELWFGGGNAGPCLEVVAAGLEIATLVFMNMKENKNGKYEINGKKYSKNPLNIVDTGYGLERIAWITQGTNSIYETSYPEIINYIKDNAKNSSDFASLYSLADHTKCLAFMLGDGVVPSNVKSGYLARLIIRRSIRFIENIKLNVSLKKLVKMQLDLLKKDFPSLIKRKKQIAEIIDIETKKYSETIKKGKNLVKRILNEKKIIDKKELISLYDTHGLQPDIVKKISEDKGIKITIPENFESMVAELHTHEKHEEDKQIIRQNLPKTIPLYYKDNYKKEFNAKVIWKNKIKNEIEIILDKTSFYPDGGGQPTDVGVLSKNGVNFAVKKVVKEGDAIIHIVDGDIELGDNIHGKIDWDRRYTLMKHHTGTHVVNGALRKLFGEHIWQAGSQLGLNEARFDFSHYKTISDLEKKEIETLANKFIKKEIPVEKKIISRNKAEKKFGFRLYQGGVPKGDKIRVLNIPNVDVEACGGTHLNNTKEIEKIKIIKTERIQDGVNRIIFAAGKKADEYQQEEIETYNKLVNMISSVYEIKENKNISEQLKKVTRIFSISEKHLEKTFNRFLKETKINQKRHVNNLVEASENLFDEWKKNKKLKKKIVPKEIQELINNSETIKGTKIKVITGISSSDSISTAGKIVKEKNYIVHIFDGKKLVSMASDNVDIDLREIAPEIGKVLGGSGGGKQRMTQSGGPKKNRVKEALNLAKKLTEEKLKK